MKAKGGRAGFATQRYRPASDFDNDTLTQKREYWRNKKREQRARVAESRKAWPRNDARGSSKPQQQQGGDSCAASQTSVVKAATFSPAHKRQSSGNVVNVSLVSPREKREVRGAGGDTGPSQKERWFQTMKLNQVLPQFDASRASAPDQDSVKCQAAGGYVTSPRSRPGGAPSGTGAPSVPPTNRATAQPSGTGAAGQLQSKTSPQGSSSTARQGVPLAKAQHKAQAVCIQPKPLNMDVTAGLKLLSSSPTSTHLARRSGGGGGAMEGVPDQTGQRKSALGVGDDGRACSANKPGLAAETEEERAAKRREQWRIKKRVQRAKVAARSGKGRERAPCAPTLLQSKGGFKQVSALSPVRTAGQKQSTGCPRAPDAVLSRFPKSDRATVDSSAAPQLAATAVKIEEKREGQTLLNPADPGPNHKTVFIKVENQPAARKTQSTFAPSAAAAVERRAEPIRRFSNHTYFSNVGRGVARCRTPRQRFVDSQKCFSNQRSVRVKYPSLAAIYNSRNVPRVLPNESPEQTASRRREYWRVKKREQRAKQSLEVKNRLKEKDSLMRRVKRYQKILEEMRRARAQTAAAPGGSRECGRGGSGPTHASETIGGFIKEDGTVTVTLPLSPAATVREDRLTSDDDLASAVCSPNPPSDGSLAHRGSIALGGNRPPPPLRPAQVRVSLPGFGGQLASRPPLLQSIRPRSQSPRSGGADGCSNPASRSVVHSPSQITLTLPPFPRDAGSDMPRAGGCVMKMAVSSLFAAPLPPPPLDDPELTEEQRMAKKREYWRVKKREQRAARATKLKHGLSMARGGSAAAHRRKTLKQTQSGNAATTRHKANTPLASSCANVPHPQQARPIKVERDTVPGPDLHIPPERAICPVKPPQSAPPQPEPDPTLSAETQATTLLAVASMKKLLEESLSTVTECQPPAADIKTERSPPPCKTEMEEYASEEQQEKEQQEVKSSIPAAVSLGEEEEDKLPLAANLTLQIKSWQDPYLVEASCQTGGPPSPQCCSAAQEEGPALASSPLRRAKRLCAKKAGNHHHHQQCCSSEPPKLHHPHAITDPTPPQKAQTRPTHSQLSSPQHQQQEQHQQQHNGRRPSDLGPAGVRGGLGSANNLQSKREYWKLMKRQQRARSKARQKGSLGYRQNSRLLSQSNAQTLNPNAVHNTLSGRSQAQPIRRTLQPKSPTPTATLTAVHSIPTLLVVSPSSGGGGGGRCLDLLQVKPPGSSFTSLPSGGRGEVSGATHDPDVSPPSRTAEGGGVGVQRSEGAESDGKLMRLVEQPLYPTDQGFSASAAAAAAGTADGARVRKWTVQESFNAAPALATLTPPENPLASINLLPMEPLAVVVAPPGCRSSNGGLREPAYAPPPSAQPPKTPQAPPAKLLPISTLAPPKPIPGESQEEFLRRKREYWRVKKKEQRARKAIRDRELSQRRAPGNWKPIRPAKDPYRPHCAETQDMGDCESSFEDPEHLMSSTSDAEMGYYSYPSYNTPMEGEYDNADGCFADGDGAGGLADGDHHGGGVGDDFSPTADDGGGGGDAWRSRYLMDHDPLNQLLVCMVCGDLLYSHSLEGVRAHIEEAHPDTLNLEPPECRRILDAWDEQVSQRERFFTSQLRHHGGGHLAEANGT